MSSDRRSRPVNRPRRTMDEDLEQTSPAPRDPRRRTSYVPRQGSARQTRQRQPEYRDEPAQTRAPSPPRYRSQQPPYRASRPEPTGDYDYIDIDEPDDRVIDEDRLYSRTTSRTSRPDRASRGRRRSEPDVYADPIYDDYGDDDDDGYDDSFIDEEDWYEEEAAAGAYRPRQRTPRRASVSLPRPSISVSRPNLPRPTVPTAVREAALVQDRSSLILIGGLVLGALGMALITMNRVDTLAPGFATHISASGIPEDIRSETALWQLPLMATALLLMNVVIAWYLAAYSIFSARILLAASVIVQVLIWVALIRIAF